MSERRDIAPYDPSQREALVRLSLRAWGPVFDSLETSMDPEVYRELYPDGWRESQRRAVESVCADPDMEVWVASEAGTPAGFAAVRIHTEARLGELYMIAVDPDFQRRGIATALSELALARMREAGMTVALVETGGDPGHAPARRTYESLEFGLLPIARYFKKL